MNKTKLTKQEKRWILYDVGNSAFTMLVATILPIYFNGIAGAAGLSEVEYLAYWGYAASIATLIVVLIGPVLGTLADTKNFKKPIFLTSIAIGIAGLIALSLPKHWLVFLAVFVVAKVGYNCSLIFYDSMLVDVTTTERMDMVSSNGYAWGYIGSCIPFVASLVIVLMHETFGLSMTMAMTLAFCINGLWWLLCSVPLLKHYEQKHYADLPEHHPVKSSFGRLFATLKDIKKDKN
ncbi:MAG: MFS transporter, partial [Peptococcaceae bacterium]|nr:MFS transporter [Peptococcaceae bacterium]